MYLFFTLHLAKEKKLLRLTEGKQFTPLTVTPFAYFDCCVADCDVLLPVVGVYAPLGWSGLPNRKAFRKLIRVNKGDRIHNNSSENDELPDGVMTLRPFCRNKI